MNNHWKILTIPLLVLTAPAVRSQESSLEGIWRDTRNSDHYFSIHVNGDRMVLIDLAAIEYHGETLSASFIGKIAEPDHAFLEAKLQVLDENTEGRLSAHAVFYSDASLDLYRCSKPVFDDCVIGVMLNLRKLF